MVQTGAVLQGPWHSQVGQLVGRCLKSKTQSPPWPSSPLPRLLTRTMKTLAREHPLGNLGPKHPLRELGDQRLCAAQPSTKECAGTMHSSGALSAVRPSRSPAPTHGKLLCVWCGCSLRTCGARRVSLSGSLCPAWLLLAPSPPARGLCPPLKPGDLSSRVVSAWASPQPWDRTQPTDW